MAHRAAAGVHTHCALRAHGFAVVLIAPVIDVVAEKVHAHTHLFDAFELIFTQHLRVLHHRAVVHCRNTIQGFLDGFNERFRGLVAVTVAVNLVAAGHDVVDLLLHLFRRSVPRAVVAIQIIEGLQHPS